MVLHTSFPVLSAANRSSVRSCHEITVQYSPMSVDNAFVISNSRSLWNQFQKIIVFQKSSVIWNHHKNCILFAIGECNMTANKALIIDCCSDGRRSCPLNTSPFTFKHLFQNLVVVRWFEYPYLKSNFLKASY